MAEVNGYHFRGLLKKTRRRFALTAGEQALYQELVDICNDENWCTSFQVSNGELTTALNCNEKTLNVWRQSLINAGLIIYKSGKSKRAFGIYQLAVQTTVKITADHTTNTTTDRGTNKGVNPSDYNKLKESKLKETLLPKDKSFGLPKKKKSGSVSSVKKPQAEYVACVDFWLKVLHPGWDFGKAQGSSLKSLIKKIQNSIKESGKAPTTENISATFQIICTRCPDWYKDKDMTKINQGYNEIIEHIKNQQNGKKSDSKSVFATSKYAGV